MRKVRKVLIRFWPTSFAIYELDRLRDWLLDRRNRP